MTRAMKCGWLALALSVLFVGAPVKKAAALTSARTQTANFSAVGSGNAIVLKNGEQATYKVVSGLDGSAGNVWTEVFEKSCDGSNFSAFDVSIGTANNSHAATYTSGPSAVPYCAGGKVWLRARLSAYTSGASSTTITESDNVVQSLYNNQGESVMDVLDGGAQDNGYRKVAGMLSAQAGLNLFARTIAQLQAIVPAVGDSYLCSNCSTAYSMVTGTGTAAGNFVTQGQTQFK